jgi:putative long chain acyl-CoA synthase
MVDPLASAGDEDGSERMSSFSDRGDLEKRVKRVRDGAQNALEMMRLGRLTEPSSTPFKVLHQSSVYALRRYGEDDRSPTLAAPILLVPPLMIASEVYDMAPDVSAVGALLRSGIDVWLVDFGAPEEQEGGLERTLDDHVLAVSDAVARVREATGHDVHLAGYSQGGMFCYQAAAYRRSKDIASLITFGSPVHIHRNLPGVHEGMVAELARTLKATVEGPLERVRGIPGFFTSTGFKLLSVRKEAQQFVDFIFKLHDREALEQRERRRRFLAGEGFVAWPGPALRQFVREFVIQNRMLAGGFVIDGQTLSLSDIHCPLLYFVGLNDTIARPNAIRPVRGIVDTDRVHEVTMRAGHFGLVVGSKASAETWPTVSQWMRWIEDAGPKPSLLDAAVAQSSFAEPEEAGFEEIDLDLAFVSDALLDLAGNAMNRFGELTQSLGNALDTMRYRLPRLRKLSRLEADEPLSFARVLADNAKRAPDQTFFLWEGRAFSNAEADRRVDAVTRGFIECGVKPGDRVGIFMRSRPSYVTAVCALNRMGAVAVLFSPERDGGRMEALLELADLDHFACDPEHIDLARRVYPGRVLSLGGGGPMASVPERVLDMEAIDPDAVQLPAWYRPNPCRAKDLSMVLFSSGSNGEPKLSRITNRRWAFAAYGAAAAATLTERDTVYCCLPLAHPAGMLVSVGSAIVGGSRLAFAETLDPDRFHAEVRRYGVTVVFYVGEMLRVLLDSPPSAADRSNPIRLFAGSGMRADIWRRVRDRFDSVGILEFYASTEGSSILANASGEKVGAVGRPLPGSTEMAVVRYDFARHAFARSRDGWLVPCDRDEPGVLVSKVDDAHPLSAFEGLFEEGENRKKLLRNSFEAGDLWVDSGVVFRVDHEGDHWILDRIEDVIVRKDGVAVFSREIEDRALTSASVEKACLVRDASDPHAFGLVVVPAGHHRPEDVAGALALELPDFARPSFLRVTRDMPFTAGFRPARGAMARWGRDPRPGDVLFRLEHGVAAEVREARSEAQ